MQEPSTNHISFKGILVVNTKKDGGVITPAHPFQNLGLQTTSPPPDYLYSFQADQKDKFIEKELEKE